MNGVQLRFASIDEEVRFLRGLVSIQRLADEVLEDCLERQLGLTAAADVFLTQCARMIHAQAAFVQLVGSKGPVLTRIWGSGHIDVDAWSAIRGAAPIGNTRTVFVTGLDVGQTRLGSLGFVLSGAFEDPSHVLELVKTVAEMFDSAVLSFLALADGRGIHERLDDVQSTGEFRPRARIGKYELLTPLGTGGMAQVMIARAINQQDVSRLVALKRILPALAHDQAIVKQFFDEAKIGMRLSHQNLVTTFDFGQAHGNFFITMELVAGVDFDEVMRWPQGPLPPELISAVMTQALEGIHAAHEMTSDDGLPWNLVHRDLSPQNLKIGFNGRVKVLDFGVAKTRTATTVTLPGIVKGKPLYMSPEQATAEAIDRRSDVFSMGLILFEALAQERAFDKREDTKTMVSIVNDPLRRHPRIPNTWWAIVEKALHKQPHLRFQTAAEMAEAIRSTVAPMTDHELASVITTAFPQRHAETVTWGRYLRPTSVQKGPSDER